MQSRRVVLLGFTVLAALLVLASAAYACTMFRGHMVLSGDGSTNHSSRIGENSAFDMDYCSGAHKHDGARANGGGTITVKMYSSTSCGPSNYLRQCPDSNCAYDVNLYDGLSGDAFYTSGDVRLDCMNGSPYADYKADEGFSVDSTGYGSRSFTIPDISPNDNAAVCVSDDNANYGNQAPLTIL